MRKIGIGQILVFLILFSLALFLGVLSTITLSDWLPPSDFRGIVLLLVAITFVYLYAFLVYRLLLYFFPLKEGILGEGSREEFVAQVYFLFYLVLFNALIRTHFLPAPLLRLIYQALGARFGHNSFCVGVILDPPLAYVGDNSIIGHDAALFSHTIEGKCLSLGAIRIGRNVTIGAKAIVMADVTIDDGAIVSAGAVVPKGSCIKAGEIWGGVPAKLVRRSEPSKATTET